MKKQYGYVFFLYKNEKHYMQIDHMNKVTDVYVLPSCHLATNTKWLTMRTLVLKRLKQLY